MSLRQLPTPQLPGVSIDIDLPRWLSRAVRIGLALSVVFLIGVGILVARFGGASDSSWASPVLVVDDARQADTGVWEFDVVVGAGTEGGALHDGWSVVLSNGGVIPAISSSGEVLENREESQIRVTAIYASAGDPIALRWDPDGRLGIHYPLDHLAISR